MQSMLVKEKSPPRAKNDAVLADVAPKRTKCPIEKLGLGLLSFWFLNHDLEEAELTRQIEELKDKGFSGFFMHPRGGLNVPYGSRSWNDVIKFCVLEARRVGLEAWLYDEDPYPSGVAGGRVTIEHPEYRATELVPKIVQIEEAGHLVVDLPPGELIAAYLICGREIRRIDEWAGLVRSRWTQFHSSSTYYPPYHDGSPHWRAMTLAPHYRLKFEAESGDATVVAFTRQEVIQAPWGHYSDLLNPKAVELFLRYTHEHYGRMLEKECGSVVPGIFTDEAKLKGLLPWSHLVPQWFFEVCGHSLWEKLPHLVLEIDQQTPFFRWAYRKALALGLRSAMVEPMIEACGRNKLLLTGHVSPEEDPILQAICVPGIMGVIGRMDIPGTDHIGAGLGNARKSLLHLSPKLASSAAHGHKKKFVACEAFAVCDWAQDVASLTKATHWLFALGINRIVTHGQFYSIDGLRKREAPPSQFFQASYWEHFESFSRMVEMMSRELTRGRHQAPLLVYYPEESFMALVGGMPGGTSGKPEFEMRESLGKLAHQLLVAGYDFDLADEEIFQKVAMVNGAVTLNDEAFEVIVVPGRHLTLASWQKCKALMATGADVIFLEREITVLADEPYCVRGEDLTPDTLVAKLRETVVPLWQAQGPLIGHQRLTEEGATLFLCNNGAQDFCGNVAVTFPSPYEICRPDNGCWQRVENLDQLELAAGLGMLIRSAGDRSKISSVGQGGWEVADVKWMDWNSTFKHDNCAVLSEFRVVGSDSGEIPSWGSFDAAPLIDFLAPSVLNVSLGQRTAFRFYSATFNWSGPKTPIRLVCDSELSEGFSTFFLNGRMLNHPKRKFTYDPMNREVDITDLICEGNNRILWREKMVWEDGRECFPYDGLRLFGKFHAEYPSGRAVPAFLHAREQIYACQFPAIATQVGHSHYGGIIEYEGKFQLNCAPVQRLKIRFGHIFETMEVRFNGIPVGRLWCAPYELEIPPPLLEDDGNVLTLACSCSPANYLQALSRPSGFLGPVTWLVMT